MQNLDTKLKKDICPCCGNNTLDLKDNNYDICEICNWENDPYQLKNPDYHGGANRISLNLARKNYRKYKNIVGKPLKNV